MAATSPYNQHGYGFNISDNFTLYLNDKIYLISVTELRFCNDMCDLAFTIPENFINDNIRYLSDKDTFIITNKNFYVSLSIKKPVFLKYLESYFTGINIINALVVEKITTKVGVRELKLKELLHHD